MGFNLLRSIRYVIKGEVFFLLKYHLTDSFQAQRYSLFKLQTKLVLCVCGGVCVGVCVYQVGDCVPFSTQPHPPPSHRGNLTLWLCRSGPASHLSYLCCSNLWGPTSCTCKLHPLLTCVAWLTCTLVAIDFVYASPIVTGFALAVVQVHLTIDAFRLEHK